MVVMAHGSDGLLVTLKRDLVQQFDGIADVEYLEIDERAGVVRMEAGVALDDDHGRIEFEGTGLTIQHAYAHLVHQGAVAWMVSRFNQLTAP
jgi:hypothetical protein